VPPENTIISSPVYAATHRYGFATRGRSSTSSSLTQSSHAESGLRARRVEFEGIESSLLSCEDLVVYKAIFNRRKDWADIEPLLFMQGSRFDAGYVRGWLVAMVGEDDERVKEFDAIYAEALAAEAADGGFPPDD
jgi:hypothetical protein